MKTKQIKLISCRAMAHILEPMIAPGTERIILDIGLHLDPDKLRSHLLYAIKDIEEDGADIILGYGLCGRALEGVSSKKSRLILPKVDDCVGAFIGSRYRHQKIMTTYPGCFFLEAAWLGSEIDIFAQCEKGLERIPEEKRSQMIQMVLKHYSRLALIDHGDTNSRMAGLHIKASAEKHHMDFIRLRSDLTILQKLVRGIHEPDTFVITDPGKKIPLF